MQSSTGAATRQGIKDALFSIALRGLRAGKASADLARQCGNANVAHALERFATEALTRQQVFVAQQRRTREANKQFGRDLNQAGVEIRQHSEADFVHVLVTALTMFEENEKVSVTGALARAYPDDPGKARSIGNSNNHKRYQKALHSHAVQKHVALADAVRAGIRELNRCARAKLFRDVLGLLLNHARLHKRIAALEESSAKHECQIFELEARVALLEAAVAETKAREGLDDTGATTSKEKVLHLLSLGRTRHQIAKHLGMNYDTVKRIIQREQRG
ncbi:MAG: hypothetical protein CVU19_15685 [Betaproteobacteria bacterium HGW-Betaproteobacteria-13]|nr:MAG: hypothetical protein CVU19_15685 [Betaproteobacteria bacterium HGW-Betaproteobacteria-13]